MATAYFDYAASCPPFPEALAEFSRVSAKCFGNPSSTHSQGQAARKLLQTSKDQLRALCGAPDKTVIATSGGTEANNLVIRGVMEKHPKGRLLLAQDVHASSWFAKDIYRKRVDVLPLEPDGKLSPEKLQRAINKRTILFSCVHVCNETGVIHDIAAYAEICNQNHTLFHCDGVQALGHIPVSLQDTLVDFYTFSSHKLGGPRGVGGVLGEAADLAPQVLGGGQETKTRAGTENVAGLAATAKALQLSLAALPDEAVRLTDLAAAFLTSFLARIPDAKINSRKDGLPGLVSLCIPGTVGPNVVAEMSLRGFAISAGSACHADVPEPPRIIFGLGRSEDEALGTLRISMGRDTTQREVEALAQMLAEVIARQRILA